MEAINSANTKNSTVKPLLTGQTGTQVCPYNRNIRNLEIRDILSNSACSCCLKTIQVSHCL